jgi:hypothetical protein
MNFHTLSVTSLFDKYSNSGTLAKHLPDDSSRILTSRVLGQGM